MSTLLQDQLPYIADVVGDPTSLEVFPVLQEIRHILAIPHHELVSIFGKRTLHAPRPA